MRDDDDDGGAARTAKTTMDGAKTTRTAKTTRARGAQVENETVERGTQSERGALVNASVACADESDGGGEALDDETFARALAGALRRCEEALTARRSYGDVMEDEFARMRRYAEQIRCGLVSERIAAPRDD